VEIDKAEIIIQVPKSISSIPVLELDNTKIGNTVIHVEIFTDHIMSMSGFIRGDFDLLMTGFTLGVSHYFENNDIYLAATPVWGVSSLISLDPKITTLQDLSGKTILVPFAKSPLDLQLKYILNENNLLEEVNIEYASIGQAVPMLLAGHADGICVPEPLASKLILKNNAVSVFRFRDEWSNVNNGEEASPQVSIFVKKNFADKYPEFVKQLISEIDSNITEIQNNIGTYAEKYTDLFNLPADVLEPGFANTLFMIYNYNKTIEICLDYINMVIPDKIIDNGFINGFLNGFLNEFFFHY